MTDQKNAKKERFIQLLQQQRMTEQVLSVFLLLYYLYPPILEQKREEANDHG